MITSSGMSTSVIDSTYPTRIQYTYTSRVDGGKDQSYIGNAYSYGAGYLGIEVGSRTYPKDYKTPETPANYLRDYVFPTQVRYESDLQDGTLGFPELPSWITGSSESFSPLSYIHAFQDLFEAPQITVVLKSARQSSDPVGSLTTGPATPLIRQAYHLFSTPASGNIHTGNVSIRHALSYWDFVTAFDPVYSELDTGGCLLRNLDTLVLASLPVLPGILGTSSVTKTIGAYSDDDPALFLWSGVRSFSDSVFFPPVFAQTPSSVTWDLAGGTSSGNIGPVYRTPQNQTYLSATALDAYSSSGTQIPFNFPLSSGTSWGMFRTKSSGSVTIFSGNSEYGIAVPIELSNAWDSVGEFTGTPRRSGESNIRFSSRIQNIWQNGSSQNYTIGSKSKIETTLSAHLGRTLILDSWNGKDTLNLPSGTTHVSLVDSPQESFVISYLNNQIIPSSYSGYTSGTVYKCLEDLSSWKRRIVRLNGIDLIPGRDYTFITGDSSYIVFSQVITIIVDLTVNLSHRINIKVFSSGLWINPDKLCDERRSTTSYISLNSSLFNLTPVSSGQIARTATLSSGQVNTDYYGTVLVTNGLTVSTVDRIKERRLLTADRCRPADPGFYSILGSYTWKAKMQKDLLGGAAFDRG